MARTIDQIIAEVSAKSDPKRQAILNQVADLPNQQQAQESSLNAQKDRAYEDIILGARRRGLGFSGIPMGEQARYAATDYAPAVANLKSTFNNRRNTLESALSDVGAQDYATAYDIYNKDRSFEEQQRQFNEQMDMSRQAARASSGGGGGSSDVAGYFGNGSVPEAPAPVDQMKAKAFNDVDQLLRRRNTKSYFEEVQAIAKSAGYGNTYDQAKLELIRANQPGLFVNGVLNTKRIQQLIGSYGGQARVGSGGW